MIVGTIIGVCAIVASPFILLALVEKYGGRRRRRFRNRRRRTRIIVK